MKLTVTKLENLLIEHGIIQPAAIESPEGNDASATKAAVGAVWSEINDLEDAPIKAALRRYHHALDTRQHGGLAQDRLAHEIEDILGTPWKQGATLEALPES